MMKIKERRIPSTTAREYSRLINEIGSRSGNLGNNQYTQPILVKGMYFGDAQKARQLTKEPLLYMSLKGYNQGNHETI